MAFSIHDECLPDGNHGSQLTESGTTGNPDRCRTQFRLVESIAKQEEAMQKFADGV